MNLMIKKKEYAYKSIGEVTKILNLKSKNDKSVPTHTIRFWEKKFKQVKPKIFTGNRRYYDEENVNILKKIKFLLKDQGMTIKGAKQILDSKEPLKLDEIGNKSIKVNNLKKKIVKISKIIKVLKEFK
tara:strand:- start:380 stop:763 length:384 start_codon:yes stop_codon:yes gene_type:complete